MAENAEANPSECEPTLYELMSETPETRRRSGNFRHPVRVILVIAFLAEACGGHSARKYAEWGRENADRLRACGLELPYGVPSHHTFSRVLAEMPPTVLKCLERGWTLNMRDLDDGEVVAIDGKALKHASTDGRHVPYVVSAWASGAGFVMGEVKTDEKSNEIKAIPKLLELLGDEISDCVVTIDAAGCQREIAETVIEVNHADYVFGLKGNQKNMHDEFLELFDTCQASFPARFVETTSVEKNGGRFEKRRCVQTDYVEWFEDLSKWRGLKSVIMVEEDRTTRKGPSHERRLYASSLPLDAGNAQRCVRAHWGVENGLHWTMDVVFREDDCRARKKNSAENRATFRHLLVAVMRRKGKELGLSVDGTCFKAVCSREFLFGLMFGPDAAARLTA